jgi:hypothetical protein
MTDPFNPFCQKPRRQIALNAQIACDHQGVFRVRVFKLTDVPQRPATELFEGAALEADEIILLSCLFGFHSPILYTSVICPVSRVQIKVRTRAGPKGLFWNMDKIQHCTYRGWSG